MTIALKRTPEHIKFVAIHNSAVAGVPADLAALKKRLASHEIYHKAKKYPTTLGEFGYTALLYHYAIAGNGEWLQTQDTAYRLWHATDYYKGPASCNQWGFGILLEGNFQLEKPTQAQLESAAQIIYSYNTQHDKQLIIKGHREYAAPSYATACPGAFMGLSTDPFSKLSWIISRVAELHGGPPVPTMPATGTVTATRGLNVRSGAGVIYPRVGVLKYGEIVKVIDHKAGWTRIKYGMYEPAWVYGTYLLEA